MGIFFVRDQCMKQKPINVDELKKTFRLRDGKLERVDLRRKDNKWKQVKLWANVNTTGYCQVRFNGRMVLYHVIVWVLSTGETIPEGLQIDHINGNRIDNRIENLRLVTQRENTQNGKVHRNGQLFGCSFNKRTGKYIAKIKISDKQIHLGYYDTEQQAHEAYRIACRHIPDYVDNVSFREMIKKEMNK